jgi:glycine betaine/proline transport system ATP-binding protein
MLRLEHITKVFGGSVREAMRRAERGQSRDEIRAATGSFVAAADVSLEVFRGEILVMMGLSGSGKSTLLRCMNGLVRPERGRVLIEVEDGCLDLVTASAEALRQVRLRHVSMVFQQHALLAWRTVRENVALGLELRGTSAPESQRLVEHHLERVGLQAFRDSRPDELSGGMKQRVGLARALATDAEVLLLDEPLGALDPLLKKRMQDELLALQRDLKKTMIFVTHDLDEALRLGSRIVILDAGRIAQIGTPIDIITKPATPYVREFVAHVNPLHVLTGASLMRPAAILPRQAEHGVLLDSAGLYICQLDGEGRPTSISARGLAGGLVRCHDGDALPDLRAQDLAAGSPELDIRAILQICYATARPMVLLDGDGKLAGVIEERDILRALAQAQASR